MLIERNNYLISPFSHNLFLLQYFRLQPENDNQRSIINFLYKSKNNLFGFICYMDFFYLVNKNNKYRGIIDV